MSSSSHPPLLFVVIPNRNGVKHLSYSLDSLSRITYRPYRAVLVDNCSTDESCELAANRNPEIEVVRNPKNVGFAGSVNVGIRAARSTGAPYIAVYSNDIRVPAGIFEPAVALLESDSKIAIVGFKEVRREEATEVSMPAAVESRDVGTDLVSGMLYVCRTAVLEQVGGYDEFYYMYGEESDLFHRVVRGGYRILQTNIPVWHYVGGTSKSVPFRIGWYSYRNDIRFIVKNKGLPHILRRLLVLIYYAVLPPGYLERKPREHQIRLERYRPGNAVANMALYLAAILWNVVFLPHTLYGRLSDYLRVRGAKSPADVPSPATGD